MANKIQFEHLMKNKKEMRRYINFTYKAAMETYYQNTDNNCEFANIEFTNFDFF